MRLSLVAAIGLMVSSSVYAEIIQYVDHIIMPDRPEYLVIPKFDKKEVPHWFPGHGRSFIDLSGITVRSSCDPVEEAKRPSPDGGCKDVTFEVLMFEDPKDKLWMDYWPNDNYCCTQSAVEEGE
jgi:hypothetical protein